MALRAAEVPVENAHDTLRAELEGVRSQIDGIVAGTAESEAAERSAASLTDQLHQRCLTYCCGLQIHHIREDGAFSALADDGLTISPGGGLTVLRPVPALRCRS